MGKYEKRGLALVLILVLIGGLYGVQCLVQTQKQAQDDVMSQAFATRATASEGVSGELVEDEPQEEETLLDRGDAEGEASEGGDMAIPTVSTQSLLTTALMTATEDTTLSELFAQEEGALLEVLLELDLVEEASLPTLDSEQVSLEAVVLWMQTQSLAAMAAQGDLTVAEAVAMGIGAEEDAERRAFAATQGENNYQATMNSLEQQATATVYQVLVSQAYVEAKTEQIQLMGGLYETVEAKSQEADCPGVALEDLADCAEQLHLLSAELEQANLEAETALGALNTLLGKDPTQPLTVVDTLTMVAYTPEDVEGLVSQGLAQRNELLGGLYDSVQEKKVLEALRYDYAPTDPVIIAQEAKVTGIEGAYLGCCNQIKLEIRTLASQLAVETIADDEKALEETIALVETATYAVDDGQSNYEAIMAVYANLAAQRSGLAVTIAQFNQAVLALGYATTVGLTTVSI